MTNQPTAGDDLVERLLAQADGSRTPSLLKQAAATIKELKAEVERSEKHRNDLADKNVDLRVEIGALKRHVEAAEARATKAEEALVDLAELSGEFGISLPMRVRNALAAIPKITGKALGEEKA